MREIYDEVETALCMASVGAREKGPELGPQRSVGAFLPTGRGMESLGGSLRKLFVADLSWAPAHPRSPKTLHRPEEQQSLRSWTLLAPSQRLSISRPARPFGEGQSFVSAMRSRWWARASLAPSVGPTDRPTAHSRLECHDMRASSLPTPFHCRPVERRSADLSG